MAFGVVVCSCPCWHNPAASVCRMSRRLHHEALCIWPRPILPASPYLEQRSRQQSSPRRLVCYPSDSPELHRGYYTGDAARMERSLHPHYLKHMIHGDIPTREKSGREMVEEIRSHGPLTFPRQSRRSRSVGWIFRETALLRNSSRRTGVDYMTLSKLDGQWRILSVVQRIDN